MKPDALSSDSYLTNNDCGPTTWITVVFGANDSQNQNSYLNDMDISK